MSLDVGSRLGHYDVTALIGEGGMGQVYKATDTRLDRTVAIKMLPEHVAADPDLKQRFERERSEGNLSSTWTMPRLLKSPAVSSTL